MSSTLSKGYKRPDNSDRGSSWFPDLSSNIDLANSHKHDGTDGEKINVKDIVKTSTNISAASWGADLGGSTYTQRVTLPAGFTFDDCQIKFLIDSGVDAGMVCYPSVKRFDASNFDVTINDNSIALKVIYG